MLIAADAAASVGNTYAPVKFFTDAYSRSSARASEKSM